MTSHHGINPSLKYKILSGELTYCTLTHSPFYEDLRKGVGDDNKACERDEHLHDDDPVRAGEQLREFVRLGILDVERQSHLVVALQSPGTLVMKNGESKGVEVVRMIEVVRLRAVLDQ